MPNFRMRMKKNMSHLLVPKSQKSYGKSGGQKSDLGCVKMCLRLASPASGAVGDDDETW